MATVTRITTWNSGDTLTANALNAEFNNILTGGVNNIENANIASGAAIATSKIAGTAATLTGSETLTNKVLTAPTLTKPVINGSVQAYTNDVDGATVTFDMTSSNIHNVTLGGNRTLAVSNVATGQAFTVILKQGSGGQTVTWWSTIKWVNAVAPTLTATSGRWDVFSFLFDGTNYYGFIVGQNLG
jgi:hypothetical protein